MDSKRWRQLDDAFQAAADLTQDARHDYLDNLEKDDPELAAEVRSLLAAETGRVADAVAHAAEDAVQGVGAPNQTISGQQFGPYRAGALLGSGGMGEVYVGERVGDDFEQRVALKVIRTTLSSDEARARFLAERRILARLQHDRIARLIDGGVADDGVTPWFAMEYVDGQPLLAALEGSALERRLQVFLEVCDAVHDAHRNRVVHSDLKPNNILVDARGRAKLLDFGIATVLSPDPDPVRDDALQVPPDREEGSGSPMTPAYAAPEQILGEAVTTATDVYALGVVLYELLTGQHPYVSVGQSGVLQQAIVEAMPNPPSAQEAPDSPVPAGRLRGDLDNICLMAMARAPTQRYSSVADLADDIRRYQDRRPVSATPDSFGYRLRRTVARHRALVATMLVAGLAIVALTAVYAARLADERDRARAEAAKAVQVSTFLAELFSASDPSVAQGEAITARALLDRGTERIDRDLADQPAVRADLLHVLGDVYKRLGLYDRALAQLDKAVALNLEIGAGREAELARARVRAGEAHLYEERFDEAAELLRAGLAWQRANLEAPSPDVADTLDLLGRLERLRRQPDAAEPLHQEALAIRRQHFPAVSLPVSESLQSLAMLRLWQGKPDASVDLTREALVMREALLGAEHPETIELQQNLATALQRTGALEEALDVMTEALAGVRKAYGEDHQNVGWTLSGMAYSLQQLGRLDEAVARDREAVAIFRQRGGGPAGVSPLVQLARHLTQAGQLDAAEAAAREALAWLGDTAEKPDPKRSNVLVDLGTILTLRGRYDEADQALRETLRLDMATYGEDHPYVAQDRYKLGDLARIAGRPADALRWLDQALARQRKLRPGANALGLTLTSHGEALLDRGRFDDAEASFREALEVFAVETPDEHPDYASARLGLGAARAAQGAVDEARALMAEAAAQLASALGDEHPKTVAARLRLEGL